MKQFDKHADAYNIIRGKIAYPERLYEQLSQICESRDSALDIGCGNGVSTVRLAKLFRYVEGVDVGPKLIEKAKENNPTIAFSTCAAEDYVGTRSFDLVTCATAFYWMDRDVVLKRMASLLTERGVFCAYKYDFPVVYGPLRDFIERELVQKWAKHRDVRLTTYDDSLERIEKCGTFARAERQVIANIITFTPREVALFFLSTSYVTRFMDQEGGEEYAAEFMTEVERLERNDKVKVNFDIHSFVASR